MTTKPKNPFTKDGYNWLKREYDILARVERPKVVEAVKEAAAHGDRSENAEYIYGKKRLREIDKRLQYLANLLKDARIVELVDLRGDKVCFSSTVVVRDETNQVFKWTIVGEGEAGRAEDTISYKAPMAMALIGRKVGDVVEIHRPKGVVELEIVALLFGSRLVAGRLD